MSKRQIEEPDSSGNVAKRIKTTMEGKGNDDKHDERVPEEIRNQTKSLLEMPDEILDKIFHSLDLADKKSLAETCKRFNEIFSRRKNLDNIWLNVPESSKRLFADTSRLYSNLQFDCSKVNVSNRLWNNNLASSLTSLSINLDGLSNLSSFLKMLPNFTNLTHLDLNNSRNFWQNISLNSRKQNSELIEMKSLTYLRIDCKLFSYLDGYLVNFTATKKLRTLILNGETYLVRMRITAEEAASVASDLSKIRSFISNQNNLEAFNLKELSNQSIFDYPVSIRSKLRELKLYSSFPLNPHQQNNICDFLNGQDRLTRLECYFIINGEKIPKMTQFFEGRLNLPVRAQNVCLSHWENRSKEFSVEDFVRGADQPNLTTEELHLDFFFSNKDEINQIAPLIASKFPNLKSIKIWEGDLLAYQKIYCYAMLLNNLKKLESVTLVKFLPLDRDLKSIMIPGLKHFHCDVSFIYSSCRRTANFIEFLSRHEGIQDFVMIRYSREKEFPEKCENFIKKVAEYALKNLKNLSSLTIDTSLIFHFQISLEWFIQLILEHAKLGFLFSYNSIEIMKRYDNKIVQKFEGKWQLQHEITANHMSTDF